MNKRDRVLSLLGPGRLPDAVPAAFFLHFPSDAHFGQPAIDRHLAYFRGTGMDFVKIQYERNFPPLPEIRRPEDWVKMPRYGREFYQPQLDVVKGLVEAARGEALVVLTLYSPFLCAGQTCERLVEHLRTDPEKVRPGLEAITDSLLWFVREAARLGADGFYTSTQGGERGRFEDPAIFRDYVKPYDLTLMHEANRACPFNILHVCDYVAPYDDLSPFLDYPGQVVSCPLTLRGQPFTGVQAAALFGRPPMGGMDRHGVLVHGTDGEIRAAAAAALAAAPARFILGADCTLPGDVSWTNIRTAVETAHAYGRLAAAAGEGRNER